MLFRRCYNPVEVGVLGFIISTASFQMLLLLLFLFANFWNSTTQKNKVNPKVKLLTFQKLLNFTRHQWYVPIYRIELVLCDDWQQNEDFSISNIISDMIFQALWATSAHLKLIKASKDSSINRVLIKNYRRNRHWALESSAFLPCW